MQRHLQQRSGCAGASTSPRCLHVSSCAPPVARRAVREQQAPAQSSIPSAPLGASSSGVPVPRRRRPSVTTRALTTPPPDYTEVDSQLLNRVIMGLFRRKMVQAIGQDVPSSGYQGIVDLTRKLNAMGSFRDTQVRTVGILVSLFPSWLLPAFKVMFAKPFPDFSCRLNAWATAFTCQWLMGKCTVNDVEVDGGKMGVGHGVKVERCRYLEQTGCAAVCVNSCKVPTQEFFAQKMGLPLTMTPNYEDYSCQFAFGKTPEAAEVDKAFQSPCLSICPTADHRRRLQAAAATGDQKQCPSVVS